MREEKGDSEESVIYRIRFTNRATEDIDAAYKFQDEVSGTQIADDWIVGFKETVAQLSSSPIRALAPESDSFTHDVRQIIYRRRSYAVAYRVLFYIDKESQDGPTVTILHVRHGSRSPITSEEANEIEAD